MSVEERDALDSYWRLTGKYPNGRTLDWLNDLIRDHGDEEVSVALAVASKGDPSKVLSTTQDILRREAQRSVAENEQRRQDALRREREDYEARMTPEKRAENLERLRQQMAELGLLEGNKR